MSLLQRNIRLTRRQQFTESWRLELYPVLTGADGEILFSPYFFNINRNGTVGKTTDNLFSLPCRSSGTIQWICKFCQDNKVIETFSFYLSAGSEISFDELIDGGQIATDTIKDYINAEVTAQLNAGVGSLDLIVNEVPSGSINGSNATFTTQYAFIPESVDVKINGLSQKKVDEFNTTGTNTINLTFSPLSGESILVSYLRG